MSEELNVVGYLHKNSVGVRILSREATIMARDEGEGWSSTPLVPAAELTTLRAQNAALVEALENTTQAFQDELDRRGVTEDLDEEELIDWLAYPSPPSPQRSRTGGEMSGGKHWSIVTALEQIRSCEFECEAGPLANNVGWQWLEAAAKVGPEFWPGQGVWFEVEATAAGKTLRQWVHFYIVGCTMTSDTERRLWTYNLSYDPPGPWHYGTTHFTGIAASKLRLEKPELVE